jgi:site-specific DNA-methyltransferase (adenine-specific)
MDKCPVVVADNLTQEQVKAYRIADNRTGELAEWDNDLLDLEIQELVGLDFDVELTGFSLENFQNNDFQPIGNNGYEKDEDNQVADTLTVCPKCGFEWKK